MLVHKLHLVNVPGGMQMSYMTYDMTLINKLMITGFFGGIVRLEEKPWN